MTQYYDISVIVTCSQGQWTGGLYSQGVLGGNESPIADSGDDQLVAGATLVQLDGCNSYDPDSGPSPLSYSWQQTGGAPVIGLTRTNICNPTFITSNSSDAIQFTLTVSDGVLTDEDTVNITVDADAPTLLLEDLDPYPGHGLDGNIGPSADTCVRARLLDNIGVDIASLTCWTIIRAFAVYTVGDSQTFETIVGETSFEQTDPGIVWMTLVPDYETAYGSGLPYGLEVEVEIEACDLVGNSMDPYQYRFKIRDSVPDLPRQTRSKDPNPTEDGDPLTVTLLEGEMAGTRIEYLDTVPVEPYFGPMDEVPSMPALALSVPPLNLQPTVVFHDPVKIFIPLPAGKELRKYKVYHYNPNPQIGWQLSVPGDGWLEYRENHDMAEPPMIEIWVKHFTGIQLGYEAASSGSGGGGSGGCFIATAAYGSACSEDVMIFRDFRDRYLLTNLPGRHFVRAYYRFSPPLADYISKHDNLKAVVRLALSPLASACKFVQYSPGGCKQTVLGVGVLLLGTLVLGITFRKRLNGS
jgi:hypothetical protein